MTLHRGDVLLSVSPWVMGTRANYYMGPLVIERVITGKSWEEGIEEILEDAAQEARERGCNAVVGVELTCDPYHSEGGHVSLMGTPAFIEPLFVIEPAPEPTPSEVLHAGPSDYLEGLRDLALAQAELDEEVNP